RGSHGFSTFPTESCRVGPRTPAGAGCPQARALIAARREAENTLIPGSSAPTGRLGAGPRALPRPHGGHTVTVSTHGRCRGAPDPGRHHDHDLQLADLPLLRPEHRRARDAPRLVAGRELPLRGPDLPQGQPAPAPAAAA